jgi:hypothetical protein
LGGEVRKRRELWLKEGCVAKRGPNITREEAARRKEMKISLYPCISV